MQAPLSSGTNGAGLETLSMTLTNATPSVQSVLGNDGHPELAAFTKTLDDNPARMVVSFTPGGLADGSNLVSFVGAAGKNGLQMWNRVTAFVPVQARRAAVLHCKG